MGKVLKEGDVIFLSDNYNYSVVKEFECDGELYFYLIRITDLDKTKPITFFASEIVNEDKVYVKVIKDTKLIYKLASVVEELLKQ